MEKAENWLASYGKHLLFLFLVVFVVYTNGLGNDFVSDDVYTIVNNPSISQVSHVISEPTNILRNFLYFAASNTTGVKPTSFRLINIMFHIGTVWIVYALFSVLSPGSSFALMTASLLAVHPLLVEAVTWISGGSYVQYSFFILLSLLLYIRSSRNPRLYYLSLLVFLLSLTSSEKSIIFPLILAFWEISRKTLQENWRKLIPYFILSFILGMIFISGLGRHTETLEVQYSTQTGGFHNPLIQIPVAVTSYLQLTIWPDNLTLYHSELAMTQIEYAIHLAIFALFIGSIIISYKKNRFFFFWLSFFFISLLPTLTPLRIASIVAERYAYLGSIGLFAVAGWMFQRLSKKRHLAPLVYGIFFIVMLGLMTRTILRNRDWRNQDTLWLATAKVSPSSHQNHNNLGDLYARRGQWDRAVEEFKIAIQLNPNYADAHHNLANVYRELGKRDEALENYEKAVKLKPALWQSHQNMAAIYFEERRFDRALEYINRAVAIVPNIAALYSNKGLIYLELGNKDAAREEFEKALLIDPTNKTAKLGLVGAQDAQDEKHR